MQKGASSLRRFWDRLPLIIRAIILGFLISTLGVSSWSLIATFIPMPYAFIIMIGILWVFIKYFSGSWWPENTKEFRKSKFRSTKLPLKTILPIFSAVLLIVIIEQSGLAFTFRIIEFPAERFASEYSFLEQVPAWAAWLVIIMISAVAGIAEETGFRGYMQEPLEKKYGALISISIVSVVFVLMHLHQAWSGPIIIHIFFISVLFGSIAYFSGSLIPGIIAHFLMDVCNFSFWWSDLGGQFSKRPISETGIDTHFLMSIFIFVAGTILFIFMMRRIRNILHR